MNFRIVRFSRVSLISESSLSYHLRILKKNGLVEHYQKKKFNRNYGDVIEIFLDPIEKILQVFFQKINLKEIFIVIWQDNMS